MTRKFKKVSVAFVLSAAVCTVVGFSANAESLNCVTSNAGITAALEQSYYTEKASLNIATAEVRGEVFTTSSQNHFGYSNLGIAMVEGHLNVREEPSETAELVGKMPADAGCDIIGVEGEWSKIKSGKVEGYVKSEFLITGDEAVAYGNEVMSTIATVNTTTLKVRQEPSLEAKVLMLIPDGEELEVFEDAGDWVYVDVNGDKGYVSKEFVNIDNVLKKAVTIEELKYGAGVSDVRVSLVQYALQFVGNPYVWGGTSLTHGADCSGFVLSIYQKYGISLPHSSSAQSGYGIRISASEAKPGDLFFYGSGGISHVAIYIGNGQVVHAFSESQGIKVTSAYYRSPICVTSLL